MPRTYTRYSLIAIALLSLAGCNGIPGIRAENEVTLDIPWTAYQAVEVRTRNGAIEVAPGQADAAGARLVAKLSASAPTREEAEAAVDQLEVRAAPSPADSTVLVVELVVPAEVERRNPGCAIALAVPAGAKPRAELRTTNGAIRVNGATDAVTARTTNGAVEIAAAGPLDVQTTNGSVTATDIAGNVKLQSTNGSLRLERITGAISATTSNGKINGSDLNGGLVARTSNGSIDVAVRPGVNAVQVATTNGRIRLGLPPDVNASLEASTSNGRIEVSTSRLQVISKNQAGDALKAKLGDGSGARVVAESTNGRIEIYEL